MARLWRRWRDLTWRSRARNGREDAARGGCRASPRCSPRWRSSPSSSPCPITIRRRDTTSPRRGGAQGDVRPRRRALRARRRFLVARAATPPGRLRRRLPALPVCFACGPARGPAARPARAAGDRRRSAADPRRLLAAARERNPFRPAQRPAFASPDVKSAARRPQRRANPFLATSRRILMLSAIWRSAARAGFGVAAALWLSPAFAHAVCGDRIFPATLGIDDPGVGDELALPTLTYLPQIQTERRSSTPPSAGRRRFCLALASRSPTARPGSSPGGYGWRRSTPSSSTTSCASPARIHGVGRLRRDWGRTGTATQYSPFNTYTPVLDVGKGFGDLPTSLNILSPFAITAELSDSDPRPVLDRRRPEPDDAELGLHHPVQPALLQFARRPDRQRLLAPPCPGDGIRLLDADLQLAPGTQHHDRHNPAGRHLRGRHVAIRLEALDPDQQRERPQRGVVAELHFFFDDIFPNSLGKPIFT